MRPHAVRFAIASVVAALLSFWTVLFLARHQPQLVPQLAISTVIVAMSLVRSDERRGGARVMPAWLDVVLRIVLVPLVALAALALGRVVGHSAPLGFAVIGVPLVLAIWVRRFGPAWSRIGSLLSFPFVAAIVTPVAGVTGHGASGTWWGALAAFVAVCWAAVLGFLLGGPARPPLLAPEPPAEPSEQPEPPEQPTNGDRSRSPHRILPSTRMAVHLAISLAAAILLGALWLPDHLGWLVLTAYLVNAGNRGRAEVVYKGAQRVVGAALGTVVATLLAGAFAPGDSAALAVIFVILGVGAVLRGWSYAWWAAAMTGALALLYGYLGESSPSLLGLRLLAIVIGGAVAIGASAFVLPVRSKDVLRKRAAELLRATGGLLRTPPSDAAFAGRAHAALAAVDSVEQLAPALRAERLVTLRRVVWAAAPAELLDELIALRSPLAGYADAPSRELAAELKARLGEAREKLLALAPASEPSRGAEAAEVSG